MSQPLLIVGSVAFDAIETPFNKSGKTLGGAASYIGLAASFTGADSTIVSVVGGDFPQQYEDILTQRNVDLTGLQRISDGKTFFWKGRYFQDMNTRETITTELNVLADFKPVVPEKFQDADFVMLGNLHPAVQHTVLHQLKQRPKLVALDTMNFWIDTALEDLLKVIKEVDVVMINDEEARQLSGEYSLIKAANYVLSMGPRCVIIKKGENGAILFERGQAFFMPAYPLEDVEDPTGAGDSFAGGFMGYLTKVGKTDFNALKNAAVYAATVASFCVSQSGTEGLQLLTDKNFENRLLDVRGFMEYSVE